MKIQIKEKESVVVVSVDNSVLQEHIPMFKERLKDIIEDKKYWIVLDLTEAKYISSMGISVVLHLKRKAKESGGDVIFTNVNQLIMNLFEVTELKKALEIYPNIDDAVQELKKRIKE